MFGRVSVPEFHGVDRALRAGVHWTSQAAPRSGASQDYAAAVAEFDVQAFVQMVASTGADYIIFTSNHADPHFPAPIVTPWQDYSAGETFSIPTAPSARMIEGGPGAGLRYQALLALEGEWVHTGHDTAIAAPVLDTGELLDFIDAIAGKGPVTLNVLIYQDGTISDLSMNVLRQIRKHLSTGSNQEPAH